MTTKLLKFISPHHTYAEPFGGGASLLFAKSPSRVEVYNDIDGALVGFFRVLQDKKKFAEFHRRVSLTPYSREEYCFCRDSWEECDDEIEKARRWYVVARMSFGGRFGASWGFTIKKSSGRMSDATANYLSIIELLPEIHRRIMRVRIEHADFRKIIETYDAPETFFYLDPPYIPSTRKSGEYPHEMTEEDHQDLINILLRIRGMAMLSGYNHPIYEALEDAGWERKDFQVVCHVAGRTRGTGIIGEGSAATRVPRTESLWTSPNCEKKGMPDKLI